MKLHKLLRLVTQVNAAKRRAGLEPDTRFESELLQYLRREKAKRRYQAQNPDRGEGRFLPDSEVDYHALAQEFFGPVRRPNFPTFEMGTSLSEMDALLKAEMLEGHVTLDEWAAAVREAGLEEAASYDLVVVTPDELDAANHAEALVVAEAMLKRHLKAQEPKDVPRATSDKEIPSDQAESVSEQHDEETILSDAEYFKVILDISEPVIPDGFSTSLKNPLTGQEEALALAAKATLVTVEEYMAALREEGLQWAEASGLVVITPDEWVEAEAEQYRSAAIRRFGKPKPVPEILDM